MPSLLRLSVLALAALTTLPATLAHSWIEEFQVIDSNGTYIGDRGFPRGYMARTDPGYNGFVMNYLLPQTGVRITTNDSLCHPAQRSSNYSNPAYPKLQVTPGSYVAMKYLENGHVTLPWNQLGKPPGGGTVFVYGTTQPSEDEKIADVLPWTSDGKGGNGKGFLMTAQNFDDGRCYQINCGNISTDRQTLFPNHVADQPTSVIEQWCETDLKIPETIAAGTLSVYWVWQWPTESNKDCTYPEGKDEYYTTCSDFEIVAGGDDANAKILTAPDTHTLAQENPQSTAVSGFKSRNAFSTDAAMVVLEGTKTIGKVVKAAATFMSACSATGNVAPDVTIPGGCAQVSVFSGAPVSSAAQAAKQFATTMNLAAPAAPTGQTGGAPIRPISSTANTTLTQTVPAPFSSFAASEAGEQTVAATTTVDHTITATVTEMPSSSTAAASTDPLSSISVSSTFTSSASTSSAPAPSAPSAMMPSYTNSTSIVYSMISTVYGPPSASSSSGMAVLTSLTASSTQPPADAPTVAADGMVQRRQASEHLARRSHRGHARSFM
ncbi:hypothetical protein LTR56_023548 [Elasticomyces elasticus]|nr:hypothetical protein LTR56_023548 [Elasticomyces elasticus]KAK3621015.1 hypothetical protein LTR22_025369 [Elasticomyces elasticus]KAK4930013.1 hypothetical protein LTR49_003340 [Elasticomyces elasticus]